MQKNFGYICVNNSDGDIDKEFQELSGLGIDERDIFIDKQKSKGVDRLQYRMLKTILRPGDVVFIKSIDRIGRDLREIKKEWEELTKIIGVDLKVVDMPLLDTTIYKEQVGSFVSNVVLEVLSFVANQEKDYLWQRQIDGIKITKEKAKHIGRPKIEVPKQWEDIYNKWKCGNITAVKAMELLNLKKSTFYKLVRQYEKRQLE